MLPYSGRSLITTDDYQVTHSYRAFRLIYGAFFFLKNKLRLMTSLEVFIKHV